MEKVMTFSEALELIKQGKRMCRRAWKNIHYVYLVAGSEFEVNRKPLLGLYEEGQKVSYKAHIDCVIKAPEGDFETVHSAVWTAAQSDIMADDWEEFIG